MERFGFVGLPNAGKSSLYNALVGSDVLAAPYAFATTSSNTGVARVVDPRLDALADLSGSRTVTPASVQFTDIGGLVEGASRGEGLGNRFLAGIREVDAVVFVLRAFANPDVAGPTDPLEHLRVLEIELTLADLETVENRLVKLRKAAVHDRSRAAEVTALEAAGTILDGGTPLYRSDLTAGQQADLRESFLLTNRPVLVVVNIGEDQLDRADALIEPVVAELGSRAEVMAVCVQLEAEAVQLPADDRSELLEGLGLGEGALGRFTHAAYNLLGLRTFFTTGDKETRAWTFRQGANAPEAAGRIHTDFQRGFIRADVIGWKQLLESGSWARARDQGLVRTEGRDYLVADGDVMEIRFNV
ncbi:redox-regulated ATPase YchF [Candidatus Poriferisocius sp.]|uniref:redox-regulated ATPase YchF n=1 Tax=Candidatus Poriferisocius sp. TaxID=3101276 RepID=UPI003B024851